MYQYSLEFFKCIFKRVLDAADACGDVTAKCALFIERLTAAVFANVSRGLFANHRETFSFLIAAALLRSTDNVWRLFLRGPRNVDVERFDAPRIWEKACALSRALPAFAALPDDLCRAYEKWRPLLEGAPIELPAPFDALSPFHQLVVVSCVARRKVVSHARRLVGAVLGEAFVAQADVDLSAPFADTAKDTPLLFILSQGADPRDQLERVAAKRGFSGKLSILSLGQGRGPTASRLVKAAKRTGQWVYLQNCHLCPSFLPALELMVQKMARRAHKVHADFRLVLSSMPTDAFPIAVLRNSVKVTSEPPRGIQPNVLLLLNTLSPEQWEQCPRTRP
jgi:dynein heavy chain